MYVENHSLILSSLSYRGGDQISFVMGLSRRASRILDAEIRYIRGHGPGVPSTGAQCLVVIPGKGVEKVKEEVTELSPSFLVPYAF